jgi:hypothetical protein
MYSTDRGIEELAARRGEEEVSLEWLADRLRAFVDEFPELETPIDRLATWLARDDADADADADTDPDDVDPSGELGQPT